jgi:hypothetical protein
MLLVTKKVFMSLFRMVRVLPGCEFCALLLAVLFTCGAAYPQADSGTIAGRRSDSVHDPRLGLPRGANEFGIWSGYSPFSFVLKGTTKDRKLFLLNLQYARTLLATRLVTFKYTADLVPVALEFQPRQQYVVDGKLLTNPADTIYGAGASPIGFQANFGTKKIQPCFNGSLGFVHFNRQVPILQSSQFNYTITLGFGVQVFPRSGHSFTVGWKYHHLSNDYQAHLNPGIDSGVFYAGFSVFRAKRD